ncbi:MAG: hypothetical protein H6816_06770 [Phycisphaerales bacterium]|nr:hypothetical protein [Phycisphaerales bacterium]
MRHTVIAITLASAIHLLAGASNAHAAVIFSYADDFNSYADYAVPTGWQTQDALVPALPPGVFSSDTAVWPSLAISPPGGSVNYNVAWSGGHRLTLIHPVETPLDAWRAVSAWYAGQSEPNYPLDLHGASLHAEFDVSIRTGTACLDFPTNGVVTSADGLVFAIQPVSALASDVARVGTQGGGLAWAGIEGLAIEFDIFYNGNEPAAPDATNHVGVDVRAMWNGGENIPSLATDVDPPVALTPGSLPDMRAVGDNNQPLHVTVFYNDPAEGGAGVVRVYLKVDPATKDPGEAGTPIAYGVDPGDPPYGKLVLEACVGEWPALDAVFGFTAATGDCDAVFQIDNVVVSADDEGGALPPACATIDVPTNGGPIVEIANEAKVADCATTGLASPGWNVESYEPVRYGIDALKTSIAIARFFGTGPVGQVSGEPDLNYDDGGECLGDFAASRPYPNVTAGSESFGILASGWICFPAAGDYIVQTRSDDGFELVLGDGPTEQLVSIFGGGRLCSDPSRATIRIAEAGVYPIRLLHFNGGGGAGLEFARIVPRSVLLAPEQAALIGTDSSPAHQPRVYGTLNGVPAPVGDYELPTVTIPVSEKVAGGGTGASGFVMKTVTAPDGIAIIESRDDDGALTAQRMLDAMQDRSGGAVVTTVNFRDVNGDTTPQPDGSIAGGVDFPGVTGDNFATRASGFATFPAPGIYNLWLEWDDHVHLKIGNQTVWSATSGGEQVVPIEILAAGTYPIRVEHVEFIGDARVELGEVVSGSGLVALNGAGSTISVNVSATSGAYTWPPHGTVIPVARRVAGAGAGTDPGWSATLAKAVDIGAGSPPVIDKSAYGTMLIENNHVDLTSNAFPTAMDTPGAVNYTDTGEGPAGRFGSDRLISTFGSIVNAAGGNDDLAVSARGYLEFPAAGDYALNFNADDGGIVWIGGVAVTLWPFGSGPQDTTPIVVHVAAPGLYDVRVDFFEHGGGLSFEFFQYLPNGTAVLVNDPASTVKVYRSLSVAPASTAYANPVRVPGSAKAAELGAGGRPGFRVQTVNRDFRGGDGNRAYGGDTFRSLESAAELLAAGLDGVPSLNQQAVPVADVIAGEIAFGGVADYPGPPNANDFATRISGYLELHAGGYLFEVDSDNGFDFWIGGNDPIHDGWNVGRSNALKGPIPVPFYFSVAEDGLYRYVIEQFEHDGLESCYFNQLTFIGGFLSSVRVNRDVAAVRSYADLLDCPHPTSDFDRDGDVDLVDFGAYQQCFASGVPAGACVCLDRNGDGAFDAADTDAFTNCLSGPGVVPDPLCE